MDSIFNYVVRRINPSNGKWEVVKNASDFQYDDKLIVAFNSDISLEQQTSEQGKQQLKEFFVNKASQLTKKHLKTKSLQVNYKQDTQGLIMGNYPDENSTPFVKCFGVISYAKGSNISEQLDY